MSTNDIRPQAQVIPLPTARHNNELSDSAALAQIAELLTVNGNAPANAREIVRRVESHVLLNREHGQIIHDMTVANQAAWIEWQHGGGAEEGMRWIENGLCGPGLLPGQCEDDIDDDAPILKDAQAYFDRYAGWATTPSPKAISTIEAGHRAARNDRELLDFMEAQRTPLDHVNDERGEPECIVLQADYGKVIGRAPNVREAIRAAIRATDPQGDLFAQNGSGS